MNWYDTWMTQVQNGEIVWVDSCKAWLKKNAKYHKEEQNEAEYLAYVESIALAEEMYI